MTTLCRISTQLMNAHEARKGQIGWIAYRSDILDTLRYWRSVRHTGDHAAQQYALARKAAL